MKKKSQPTAKPKEFATSPFAALKGVKADSPQGGVSASARPAAPKAPEPDDTDLFLRAMADVDRLQREQRKPGAKSAPLAARPKVRRIEEEERQLFLQELQQMKLDVTFRDEIPAEEPRSQASPNRLRQLRRGTVRIDYELDLHGLTRDEATVALAAFIGGAYRRGQQAVLVITGKGNNSPGEPVLLKAVMAWLRTEGKEMVSETLMAPGFLGGDGAVVVFIRSAAAG